MNQKTSKWLMQPWRELAYGPAFGLELTQLAISGFKVEKTSAKMDTETGVVKTSFTIYHDGDIVFLELKTFVLTVFPGFRIDFVATGTSNHSEYYCSFYLISDGSIDTTKFLPYVDLAHMQS